MRTTTAAILAALVALVGLTPSIASAVDTTETGTEITFRAAPAGFVVPSAFVVNNEAHWIVDPLENPQTTQAPGVAGCQLTVTDRNGDDVVDGEDVLDEAEATGCIDSWSGRDHDSCADGDVFVAEVDGLTEVFPATFWIVHRNGQLASTGICGLALEDGESLGFVYE